MSDDQAKAEIAREINARLPGWVVLWGPYHRRFTAFGACTPAATIIDDPVAETLVDRMRAAQFAALYQAQTVGGQ